MEVKIKNIGWNKGTSGWLKENLESGKMWFAEGITKSGRHGLYLQLKTEDDKTKSQPLALYNPYDLESGEYAEAQTYVVLSMTGDYEPGSTDNRYCLTPAAARAVLAVAQEWCDKKNEERESDPDLQISVSFT